MKKQEKQTQVKEDEFLYGLKGLAEFIGISTVSAGKLKDKLPFYQFGPRMIRFKKSEVVSAIEKNFKNG